jgi:hypothetical protein
MIGFEANLTLGRWDSNLMTRVNGFVPDENDV